MSRTSTLRIIVDQALGDESLEDFITVNSQNGQPLHEVHQALVNQIGIPVPLRTFYRWAETATTTAGGQA